MYFLSHMFMVVLGLSNSSFLNGLNVSTILFDVCIVTIDKMILTLSCSFGTHIFKNAYSFFIHFFYSIEIFETIIGFLPIKDEFSLFCYPF